MVTTVAYIRDDEYLPGRPSSTERECSSRSARPSLVILPPPIGTPAVDTSAFTIRLLVVICPGRRSVHKFVY